MYKKYMGFVPYEENMLWICLNHAYKNKKKTCVVFCNPLLDERITCHPYYVYFSKYLTKYGISSVRFDYLGTGESMPPTSVKSVIEYSKQIKTIISIIKNTNMFDVIGVFGVSSSSLAIQELRKPYEFNFCIIWEPVINTKQYRKTLYRANMLEQQTIFNQIKYDTDALDEKLKGGEGFMVEGYKITSHFLDSLENEFIESIINCNVPLRIECFKIQTLKKLKKIIELSDNKYVNIAKSSIETMFWRSSCIKYLDLPIQNMEECAKWIQIATE